MAGQVYPHAGQFNRDRQTAARRLSTSRLFQLGSCRSVQVGMFVADRKTRDGRATSESLGAYLLFAYCKTLYAIALMVLSPRYGKLVTEMVVAFTLGTLVVNALGVPGVDGDRSMEAPEKAKLMPDRLLRRRVKLRNGAELRTISEALALIKTIAHTTTTGCPTLEAATEQLLVAAGTGKRGDIRSATDQLEAVLRTQQLL